MKNVSMATALLCVLAGCGAGTSLGDGGGAGAGGATACQKAAAADRTCATDTDCVAVTHTTNCCGSAVWMGVRASTKAAFDALEAACDRSYPRCGCAAFEPTTDDGSLVPFGGSAAVSCQAGTCKTFSTACGHACDAGRSCSKCTVQGVATSACTLRCMQAGDCTEAPLTMCQFIGTSGLCIDPTAECNPF